jgi:hypothetical protein
VREAEAIPKLLVVAALVVSVGEIARRALPTEWDLYVSLTTAVAIAVGSGVVLTRWDGPAR